LSGKRKFDVESIVSTQTWVIVIVNTIFTLSLGFAKVVNNRSAESFLPIITSVCRPGTIIITD
jgi:hypothetical protein